jgi:hypothetical protein
MRTVLDATDPNHDTIDDSECKEEMHESFGDLSESNPNFQGALESVVLKQLPKDAVCLENWMSTLRHQGTLLAVISLMYSSQWIKSQHILQTAINTTKVHRKMIKLNVIHLFLYGKHEFMLPLHGKFESETLLH